MSKGISSMLSRCMKATMRLLCSIRDLYVRGMTACAGKVGQYPGVGVACPSFSDHLAYDRSFSSSSSRRYDYLDDDEDLRELIRAASIARYADRGAGADHVRRSQSVVVGRIDEDQPCEFEEAMVGSSLIFPRSSSQGVGVGIGVGVKKRRGSKVDVFA